MRFVVPLLLIAPLTGVAAAQESFDGTWRVVITCAPHAEDGGARGYSYGFPARVQDGVLQRSWCIIPGDPPGTYTYDITIDGQPRGEFVFCAIEIPDQNPNIDPRDLHCPNKFNAVERARPFSLPKAS